MSQPPPGAQILAEPVALQGGYLVAATWALLAAWPWRH